MPEDAKHVSAPLDDPARVEVLIEMMTHYASAGVAAPLGRDDLVQTIEVADRWIALNHYAYAHTLPHRADRDMPAADKLILLALVALKRAEKLMKARNG